MWSACMAASAAWWWRCAKGRATAAGGGGGRRFGADGDRAGSQAHRLASNLGHTLARLLSAKLGIRARAEKPGLLGRCCGEFAVPLDRREAFACGRAAAVAAGEGHTDVMVALRRDS